MFPAIRLLVSGDARVQPPIGLALHIAAHGQEMVIGLVRERPKPPRVEMARAPVAGMPAPGMRLGEPAEEAAEVASAFRLHDRVPVFREEAISQERHGKALGGLGIATGSRDSTILIWDVTGLLQGGRTPVRELTAGEFEKLWTSLAEADAAVAHRAVWTLVAAGEPAVAFLEQRLRPVSVATGKRIASLIVALDDDRLAVREEATRELRAMAELACPALRKTLAARPSAEVRRRIEGILENQQQAGPSSELLRTLRALAVVEQAHAAEPQRLLRELARGAPGARITQEAKWRCCDSPTGP